MAFTFETMFDQDQEFRQAVLLVGGAGRGMGEGRAGKGGMGRGKEGREARGGNGRGGKQGEGMGGEGSKGRGWEEREARPHICKQTFMKGGGCCFHGQTSVKVH
jgi:hypothetical protein